LKPETRNLETLNIHIPHIDFTNPNRQSLFILTRPFYTVDGWKNDKAVRDRWGVGEAFQYTPSITTADALFIPHPVNTYSKKQLEEFNALCEQQQIKGYGYIAGDYGKQYPEFSNLTYFRMGGFKSQLSDKNRGFPVVVSDKYTKLFGTNEFEIRPKKTKPLIGFCGYADFSGLIKFSHTLRLVRENLLRFISNPFRKDYEPLFASAYERARLLGYFEKSPLVETQFIYRRQYRAGVQRGESRAATTHAYFENIKNSDYILCVRGAGNFSVRLYETLMMGRIPVFVNTDCLLPFEDKIDWKKHLVWVEWKDRKDIAARVAHFHANLNAAEYEQLQMDNRRLWEETLSVNSMLDFIKNS